MFYFQDGDWIHIGKYETEKNIIQFTKDPIFPGGSTLPSGKAGKVIYKVAAFFPKHRVLGALSDLGKIWVIYFFTSLHLVSFLSSVQSEDNFLNRGLGTRVRFEVKMF